MLISQNFLLKKLVFLKKVLKNGIFEKKCQKSGIFAKKVPNPKIAYIQPEPEPTRPDKPDKPEIRKYTNPKQFGRVRYQNFKSETRKTRTRQIRPVCTPSDKCHF